MRPRARGPHLLRRGDAPKSERAASPTRGRCTQERDGHVAERVRRARERKGRIPYAGEMRPRARGPHLLRGRDAPENDADAPKSERGVSLRVGGAPKNERTASPTRGRCAQEREGCVDELGEIHVCRSWIAPLSGGDSPESEKGVFLHWGRRAQERDGCVNDAGEMRPRAR
jgi:hypothetical protein